MAAWCIWFSFWLFNAYVEFRFRNSHQLTSKDQMLLRFTLFVWCRGLCTKCVTHFGSWIQWALKPKRHSFLLPAIVSTHPIHPISISVYFAILCYFTGVAAYVSATVGTSSVVSGNSSTAGVAAAATLAASAAAYGRQRILDIATDPTKSIRKT